MALATISAGVRALSNSTHTVTAANAGPKKQKVAAAATAGGASTNGGGALAGEPS